MENTKKRKPWVNWALFIGTMVLVFLLGLLASSVIQRKAEKEYVFKPTVKISEWEARNEVWGMNFPREFQSYMGTADTSFRSLYNGNAFIDMLEEEPRLVILWAGYAFSKDYNQPRGHFYAVEDVYNSLRTGAPKGPDDGPQPNTCWTCKSPDVPRMMAKLGVAGFYKGKWASLGSEIINPIGCGDCHDPETMDLRITRPALLEAFTAMGKDLSKATHQEMRSLVCAQCHVEYYFDKKHPGAEDISYLTFPWKDGTSADSMLAYYNKVGHVDFVHAFSKAPILKAQHPDYEAFLTGVHYDRGVACADCHMPYMKEGGQKFTSHRVTSPLAYINQTCQVCHRESEEKLIENVYQRQRKVKEIRDQSEVLLVRAHMEAKAAWDAGATEPEMQPALEHIRNAQWYWDYAAAGHGNSFHAPLEMARIIAKSIDETSSARLLIARILQKLKRNADVPYPDITTKEKAQKLIGLDTKTLSQEKKEFLNTTVKSWTGR
ncbi:MAG: ammonia-forming cytochrome c nitrite reductase [Bacteroidetes bacterium]|nr:ammonia-forming cytochrome c nitrite reductase [Bacteroidota bacterium]